MRRALVGLSLAACVEAQSVEPPAVPESPPAPANAPVRAARLRDVDWGNLAYEGLEPSSFRLRDGRAEIHEYMVGHGTAHTTDLWLLDAVGYGDVGGDGNEDAAVAISYHFYGNGHEHHALDLVAFALVDGGVAQVARARLPAGRVDALVIASGTINVKYTDHRVVRLRFDSGRLVEAR